MRYLRRSAFLRVVVLPLTLTLWLGGCRKQYVAVPAPYAQTLVREELSDVMLTLDDGSRFHVHNPRIVADSLVGVVYDAKERSYTDTVHVALAEVSAVEKRRGTPAWAYVAAGALVVGVVAWAAAYRADCRDRPNAIGC